AAERLAASGRQHRWGSNTARRCGPRSRRASSCEERGPARPDRSALSLSRLRPYAHYNADGNEHAACEPSSGPHTRACPAAQGGCAEAGSGKGTSGILRTSEGILLGNLPLGLKTEKKARAASTTGRPCYMRFNPDFLSALHVVPLRILRSK